MKRIFILILLLSLCCSVTGCITYVKTDKTPVSDQPKDFPRIDLNINSIDTSRIRPDRTPPGGPGLITVEPYIKTHKARRYDEELYNAIIDYSNGRIGRHPRTGRKLSRVALSYEIPVNKSTGPGAYLGWAFGTAFIPPLMIFPRSIETEYRLEYELRNDADRMIASGILPGKVEGSYHAWAACHADAPIVLIQKEEAFILDEAVTLLLNDLYKKATNAAIGQTKIIVTDALPKPTWQLENIALAQLATTTLSKGEAVTLTQTLQATLVESKYFRVLARGEMNAILKEQEFSRTDNCDDSQCLIEMGKLLATKRMIGGTIGKVGSTYQLSLMMINVETGELEDTAKRTVKGQPDELLKLIEETGRQLCVQYAGRKTKGKRP